MNEQATSEQITVIQAPLDTHIKVIAVAGSGKSWTMRRRVSFLLEAGIHAQEIMVLMFNKSAQLEFELKMKELTPRRRLPQTRTYHSLGFRLCESLSKKGYLPKFNLNTSASGQALLAKQALKMSVGTIQNGICNPNRPNIIEAFISYIDLVKSGLTDPEAVFDKAKIDTKLSPFISGYSNFEKLRIERKERFFSDLIYDPVKIISNSPDARAFVSNRLKQIVIDEYQDINDISQELIKLLAGESAYVTAVGDDSQTLYSFRGSRPEYLIDKFDNDFLEPAVYTLSETFRYGHTISIASNNVVANNTNKVEKLCISSSTTPKSSIELHTEPNVKSGPIPQTALIKSIQDELDRKRPLSDFAILVRLFSMTPPIELALMRAGIPYRLEGRLPVFDLQEVSALTNLLRLAANTLFTRPKDYVIEALTGIFLLPHPGISLSNTKQIVEAISQSPNNIIEIVANAVAELPTFMSSRLNRKADAIHTLMIRNDWTAQDALTTYLEMTECRKCIQEMSLNAEDAEVVVAAIDAYIDFCESKSVTTLVLIDLIESLRSEQKSRSENRNTVLITSVHRSKGLEWPVVLLPRLAEGYFPYIRDDGSVDIQSERRLFYVGMTRAIEKLVLVVPPDEHLASAFQLRTSAVPVGLHGNNKRASRFIYEANLRLSIELGQTLYSSTPYCDIETASDPTVINKYLTRVGAQFRITKTS
ncbi:ATP-dependent helicase [Teredinibacter purpureus]|uniref:ATP-dependent helicase n=1 Tax=Teredinibacter purpureus TaxID=2731756 RepID=UPI0005F78F61|nr:ATP-dependent helicase [Teredinibacter purpureus]